MWPCICCRILELLPPPSTRSEERALNYTKQGACMAENENATCVQVWQKWEPSAEDEGDAQPQANGLSVELQEQVVVSVTEVISGSMFYAQVRQRVQNLDRGWTAAEIMGFLFSRLCPEHRGATRPGELGLTASQELSLASQQEQSLSPLRFCMRDCGIKPFPTACSPQQLQPALHRHILEHQKVSSSHVSACSQRLPACRQGCRPPASNRQASPTFCKVRFPSSRQGRPLRDTWPCWSLYYRGR